jgi:hypothetical protein
MPPIIHALSLPQQGLPAEMHGRVGVIDTVGAVHSSKHRLQGVVIALRDGIKFMVVTTGTMDGGAGECLHHRHQHVVAVEVPANLAVNRVLAYIAQRTLIPRPRGDQAERDRGLWVVRKKRVARDLFLNKASVRFVIVE